MRRGARGLTNKLQAFSEPVSGAQRGKRKPSALAERECGALRADGKCGAARDELGERFVARRSMRQKEDFVKFNEQSQKPNLAGARNARPDERLRALLARLIAKMISNRPFRTQGGCRQLKTNVTCSTSSLSLPGQRHRMWLIQGHCPEHVIPSAARNLWNPIGRGLRFLAALGLT
jgi:hypothetical protein